MWVLRTICKGQRSMISRISQCLTELKVTVIQGRIGDDPSLEYAVSLIGVHRWGASLG